jgi:hypothetical protein
MMTKEANTGSLAMTEIIEPRSFKGIEVDDNYKDDLLRRGSDIVSTF